MIRRLLVFILLPALAWAGTYNSIITADNPCHWYHLGEASGDFADSPVDSCANQKLLAINTPTYGATGIPGNPGNNAITFASASSQFGITNTNEGTWQPTATVNAGWSFEIWVNGASHAATQYLGSGGDHTSPNYNWDGFRGTDLHVGFGIWDSSCGGVGYHISSGTAANLVTDGTYHHVVFTSLVSGTANVFSRVRVYVDGALKSSSTSTTGTSCATINTRGTIAERHDDTSFYNGTLDEVAIYRTELTATQVQKHYNCGALSQCSSAVGSWPFITRSELPYEIIARYLRTVVNEPSFIIDRMNKKAVTARSQYAETGRF